MNLLDYLGASKTIVDQLKEYSSDAEDEIGMLSAWKVFGHIFPNVDIVKVVKENIEFLVAHDKDDLLLPSETISIPTCLPQELLQFIDPTTTLFFGVALIPGIKLVRSNNITIYLLRCDTRACILKNIFQVLMNNDYIIITISLNCWECIPPANTKLWNNAKIYATYETTFQDVLLIFGCGFYLDSSLSVCFTVSMQHSLIYGNYFYYEQDVIKSYMSGLVIHPNNMQEFKITKSGQSRKKCKNFTKTIVGCNFPIYRIERM